MPRSFSKLPPGYGGCIEFHPGVFQDTATGESFSLVNLDVDTYRSTGTCLEYFYPRMVRGGCIISHDYRAESCPGVKLAIDEFFEDKPETLIELWHTQIVAVKL